MILGLPEHRIEAVAVNHNTSAYMELMLRSFYHFHAGPYNLKMTIFDNDSQDGCQPLQDFAAQMGVAWQQSGFGIETANNSHGDVLRSFVLARPDCTHYLFLDADVVFLEADTLGTMLRELQTAPDAFGIGARMSWDGLSEIPREVTDGNPDVYSGRLHPCCALAKNTPVFRLAVEEVGMMCADLRWAERSEYLDTFKLLTKVMRTHGLRHIRSRAMVQHFFCVSYDWDEAELRLRKQAERDRKLAEFRGATSCA